MRWTSEGSMVCVCACDTSDKRNETIVVFDGNESSSSIMRSVFLAAPPPPHTHNRRTCHLAFSFFFVSFFFLVCNTESLTFPPYKAVAARVRGRWKGCVV